MVNMGIVIPWRLTPERTIGFEAASRRINELYPDVPIYRSDSIGEIFNPSEARNRGCLSAIVDGCEVLVVLDADTLFDPASIEEAIEIATSRKVVCYPYTTVQDFNEAETNKFNLGLLNPYKQSKPIIGGPITGHVGSGWVMTAQTFKTMNGWDERFLGWGYEDTAFQETHKKLLGVELERANGKCFRLYHGHRILDNLNENRERYALYEEATPDNIEELIFDNLVHLIKQK